MRLNVFLLILLLHGAAAVKPPAKWQTLSGEAPVVVARGGFSGIFPESSQYAYQIAESTSLKNVVLLCDLQLTKDGGGICQSDLRLDNSTTISSVFPKGQKTYSVNGQPLTGWFSVDFTSDQIYNNVSLIQNIFTRPSVFDGSLPISMVEDVTGLHPYQFWINVQYSIFFKEHKQDVATYITTASEQMVIDYISSPEIAFLKSLSGKLRSGKTKLIFRFLEVDDVEPSAKQTYKALLNDLSTIKSFASGILVPKSYIWPVNKDQYLEPHTSLVTDAHNLGLEVYASNFANDMPASYNYSFDPTAEYLQFIDNSNFSVDGVLTDFPSTASEAVACLAHNKNNTLPTEGRPLIITHNGASGVFAGCTDLAYQQAAEDGADILDCSVQMSKDGVVFCLDSADLMGHTTAIKTFMPRATVVPEIQKENGIFSFDLTWSEIQSLKPELTTPLSQSGLARNPAAKNQGKFMTLTDFLEFAKKSTVAGVLINIENAGYLASKKGLGIVEAVSTALTNASYDKLPKKQVLIQSDDTAVLSAFKKNSGYKRVLYVKETISDAPKPTVDEIKHSADAVNLPRSSIVADSGFFVSAFTGVVDKMHAANISVYVSVLRNEFLAIAFDYFSDPMVELATYVAGVQVDGVATEFPATLAAYLRSPCSNMNAKLPYSILPVEPGSLLSLVSPEALPPAEAPAPVLAVADIQDPPLPPVADLSDKASVTAAPQTSPPRSGQSAIAVNAALSLLIVMLSFVQLRFL
ncbi:glycerophosphodiester phosphodiesterase GDPDL6-like [Musa acuminata AAA Group]|uniref:glycerophosphodiester phosphodiesterase GDPDL6-like n=1 Tax=Musa acuminata AAA Group TaxID=214697 RepID=UPI0031D6B234